ncbi:NADH dehydrogenase [ubiquinone] 1 beta subcomplex subunit 9, partial [Galemys pyrenaicus]
RALSPRCDFRSLLFIMFNHRFTRGLARLGQPGLDCFTPGAGGCGAGLAWGPGREPLKPPQGQRASRERNMAGSQEYPPNPPPPAAEDNQHLSRKAKYPDYFAKKEQWKKLSRESWVQEVKPLQDETPPGGPRAEALPLVRKEGDLPPLWGHIVTRTWNPCRKRKPSAIMLAKLLVVYEIEDKYRKSMLVLKLLQPREAELAFSTAKALQRGWDPLIKAPFLRCLADASEEMPSDAVAARSLMAASC